MINLLLILPNYNDLYSLNKKHIFELHIFTQNKSKSKFKSIAMLDNNIFDNIDSIVINDVSKKSQLENIINSVSLNKKIHIFSNLNFNITNSNCEIIRTIKYSKIIDYFLKTKPNYLSTTTNISKSNINNIVDSKCHFRSICLKILPSLQSESIQPILLNQNKEAVYIEYRPLKHSETLIYNCILKLGSEWSYTVVCGKEAFDFYSNICKKIHKNIKVINTGHEHMDQNTYNNLLLTKDFWELIYGEKVLIYQEDSFIFKNNINDFIEWDYIGAPFKMDCIDQINVGNGGLSLRSKSKMIDVLDKNPLNNINISTLKPYVQNYIKNYKLDNIPEDIYFSTYLQKTGIGNVADFESAKQFSSDTIYNEDSFGMHRMWNGCKDWEKYIKCHSEYKTKINSNAVMYNYMSDFENYCSKYLNYTDLFDKEICFENKDLPKKSLILIACHTENKLKYDILKNNLHFLNKDYVDIILICSLEHKNMYEYKFKNLNVANVHFIENDNMSDFGKWLHALKITSLPQYENIIFTNDSIIITDYIDTFLNNALNKKEHLYGFNDSLQNQYHYQSFLFSIKTSNIAAFIELIEKYKKNIFSYNDLIKHYEFGLVKIYESKDCFLKIAKLTNGENLQFTADYIYRPLLLSNLYPIIKLKRLKLHNIKFADKILQKLNIIY